MADNDNKSGAKHELGNLFVDIGSSGLGTLLKGLNSLSATFMLTKNAAQQFTKPIVNLSKNASQGLVGLQKINAVTGLTIDQLQELQQWSKLNNVDFGSYINQISNLQQNLLDIAMGQGNTKGLTLLGIDPRSLDYNKPLEALDKIKKRVLQLDEATGALALKELGLSSDLLYQWRKENQELDKRLLLNDKEKQNLEQQNNAWNRLGVTWEAATSKLIGRLPVIADWINKISGLIAKMPDLADKFGEDIKNGSLPEKTGASLFDKTANFINNYQLNEIDKKIEKAKKYQKEFATLGLQAKNEKTKLAYLRQAEYENARVKALQELRKKYEPKSDKSLYEMHQERIKKNSSAEQQRINDWKQGINDWKQFQAIPKSDNSLISYTPINDIPANLTGDNNILPPVPQAALASNAITNNITINQDISGTNAYDIATKAAAKIDDTFDNRMKSLERSLSHGL